MQKECMDTRKDEMDSFHAEKWGTDVAQERQGRERKGGVKDKKVILSKKCSIPKRAKWKKKGGEKQGLTDQSEVWKHQSALKTSPRGTTDHTG